MKLTSLISAICHKDVEKIGFFGLGKSNTKLAEILQNEGWERGFTYRQSEPPKKNTELDIRHSYFGEKSLSNLSEDILFLSPSLRRSEPLLSAAEQAGCVISSDAELFFSSNPENVFAITGSDGKSTSTFLTSELTKNTLNAKPAGNFGLPLCELLASDKSSGAVIELSSFQLMYMKPKLSRALITNITENHLNWHSDFDEYIRAKKNIFENADCRAITLDSAVCEDIARKMRPDILISDRHKANELYSLCRPQLVLTRELGSICINGEPYISENIFLRSESYIIKDFMCALAISHGYTDKDVCEELARTFGGLAHRNERFLVKHGITYINSSIDSTPERTAVTLASLCSPAIVIIGGAPKNLPYAPLISALKRYAKAVILTGESAYSLFPILYDAGKLSEKLYLDEDFEGAVKLAVSLADEGDTVILSPAHTSFDVFSNFEQRGDYFKKIVKDIIK